VPRPEPPASPGIPEPPQTLVIRGEAEFPTNPLLALRNRLNRLGAGSEDAADIERLLELERRLGRSGPGGRKATIQRALSANAWFYLRYGAPSRRTLIVDPDGIILTYRRGHGFAVNPVATTGRWRGLNDDVPPEALAEALLSMGSLLRAADREYLAWEYFDAGDDPSAIRPGLSGMAQGRMAGILATALRRTGDPKFARAARMALGAFTVPVGSGGVLSRVSLPRDEGTFPWYVERAYPGESPWKGAALNGFMVSILNLRGAAADLRAAADAIAATAAPAPSTDQAASPPQGLPETSEAAALGLALADDGAATLARYLSDHDSGSWTYYGLLTPGRPWRSYLADLNYHCYHVTLLRQLAPLYPEHPFAATAERWQGYVDREGLTCPPR
jgi:hypothetical protein